MSWPNDGGKKPRDRVEMNHYGVRCVIGYRRVAADGSVRIGGKTLRSPRLVKHAGEEVFLSPYSCYGDYQALPMGHGNFDPIELEDVTKQPIAEKRPMTTPEMVQRSLDLIECMTPDGIQRAEAAGQSTLVAHRDRLPVAGTVDSPAARAKWEAAGFVFGDPIREPGRPTVFVACTFPAGWELRATDHSMWSDLLGPDGRKRASVFFKAAAHDYAAHAFGLEG